MTFTADLKHYRLALFVCYHYLGRKKHGFGTLLNIDALEAMVRMTVNWSSVGHQCGLMYACFVVFACRGLGRLVLGVGSCQGVRGIDLTVESLYCYLH